MSIQKSKSLPCIPQLACDAEVIGKLERLRDSVVSEMTTHKSGLQPQQNDVEKENLDACITALEQELADKAAQLNCSNTLEEEELRKLEPELEKIRTQIKLEKELLLIEKIQLELLLKEKEQLLVKTAKFEKRLITAEEKFVDFTNEVKKLDDTTKNINSLPDEIMVKIFGYLKHNQLGEIARVCKKWNLLTKCPVLWKTTYVQFSPSHQSQTTVATYFVDTLPSCVTRMELDFTKLHEWPDRLNFKKLCEKLHQRCPVLERLVFAWANLAESQSVLDLVTQFLPSVKVLAFHDTILRDKCPDPSGTCNFEILDYGASAVKHLNSCTFPNMPNLKQLCFCDTVIDDTWIENNSFLLNQLQTLDLGAADIGSRAFQIIQNNGRNLKVLYLCWAHLTDNDLRFDKSMLPNLETVCLKLCDRVTSDGVVSLIQSCNTLKTVYVNENVAEFYAIHPLVITKKCKLEIVKIIDFCCEHREVEYLWDE